MQCDVLYTRIYSLPKSATTTKDHPLSRIQVVDFPHSGLQAEIHIGAVPALAMEALKVSRAWSNGLLRGRLKNADELRNQASAIPDEMVLSDSQGVASSPTEPHWYATLIIKDRIELQEDQKQQLYGVTIDSWASLDRSDFFDRHAKSLDLLSVRTAFAVEPYRYLWVAWDAPLVRLPTGIALRPPRAWLGRPRAFMAPPIEQLDLSSLRSPVPRGFESVPMALHFYLRAATESDRVERFFFAFRALEVLCRRLARSYAGTARTNCASAGAGQPRAIGHLRRSRPLEKQFAILALALGPADADMDLEKFSNLYDWRNDLAHGKRSLEPEKAPDEETFELLHKYLAALR